MRSKNIERHPEYCGRQRVLGDKTYYCLDTGVPDPEAYFGPTIVAHLELPHAVKVDYKRGYAPWLNKHCQGFYVRESDTFYFENVTDAVYFKLMFVGR